MEPSAVRAMSGTPRMRRVQHLHFVGVGGAGMCGIAEVMLNEGYRVTGSDLVQTQVIDRLCNLGADIWVGHDAQRLNGADVVVKSTAIPSDNVEVVSAQAQQIPVVPRAEMLGELLRHRYGIAVAGTHGKTTTTSILTSIFQTAGLDPTFVIGGLLKSEGSNARLGQSWYLITEADESDASFLYLNPMIAVICNIDRDHLGTYDQQYTQLLHAFQSFVHRLPFYGLAVVCIDDPGVQRVIDGLSRPLLTYGIHEQANFRATEIRHIGTRCHFAVVRPEPFPTLSVEMCLPGIENVRNAVGAIAVATDEGVSDECIVAGLKNFTGISRRFEITEGQFRGHQMTLIDDYGHHPVEILHVIDTARMLFTQRRLVMVFQPHRFTRTRDLLHEFVEVLVQVDVLILVETYAASESPIDGAATIDLFTEIHNLGHRSLEFAATPLQAIEQISQHSKSADVVCVQGAGNVDVVSTALREEFE